MITINLSERQKKIIEIVKNNEPIPSKEIAEQLDLTRGALRSDLSVLTMANILKAKPKVGYFYSQDNSYLKDFDELYGREVKEIKSAPIVIKEEGTSVYDAIVTLFLEDAGSIFVINDSESLVGVVSRKDLLKITMGETDINQVPVSVAMTRMPHIITVKNDDTIFEAAKKLVDYEIDVIPVIEKVKNQSKNNKDDKLKVIGKVSKTNITRVFVDFGLDI
ncbi:helix-turn-helix transcriptional regulator [Halanaerocella petrolearia]